MSTHAERILRNLTGDLEPIRELALRYDGARGGTEPGSHVLLLSHRPKIAELAYALTIFPGVDSSALSAYEKIHDITIPGLYRGVLTSMNGAELFEVSLFGIPPSMAKDPPLLDRSGRSPLDLATAQKTWIRGYKIASGAFLFGGGPHSYDENLGYFLFPHGAIRSIRKNGTIMGEWPSFIDFLRHELARAEASFPSHEETMAAINEEIRNKKPVRKKKRSK